MAEQDVVKELVEKHLLPLQYRTFGSAWPRDLDELIERYYVLISQELAEVLNHTNFKHHKKKKSIDMPALQEECIDVVIYALDMALAAFDGDYDLMLQALKEKAEYNDIRSDWETNKHRKVS